MALPTTEVDPQTVVVPPEAPTPFAGITVGKGECLNAALAGLPVEVYGGRWQKGPEVYIFGWLALPGMRSHASEDLFKCIGDLTLRHAERRRGCWIPTSGSSRVLSATLVRRFDVLAMEPEYWVCSACGYRIPRTEKVYDIGGLSSEVDRWGEFEWQQRLECRGCWWSWG